MIKKTIRKFIGLPGQIKTKKTLSTLKDGDYLIGDVPYQCQFASPKLVADILDGKIKAKNDPNWALHGFKTPEESEYWVWRDCGICCIKMVLDYYGKNEMLAKLVEEGVSLKGYNLDKDLGWYYKPLINLANKYGVQGFTKPYLGINEISQQIYNKRFVIASVNPGIIRFDKIVKSKSKNGHLILVIGFRMHNSKLAGFYIHNPSGKTPETQKKAFIPIKTFIKAYGERGIVLSA